MPEPDQQQKKAEPPHAGASAPVLHLQGSRPDRPLPASLAASIDEDMAAAVHPAPPPAPASAPVAAPPPPAPATDLSATPVSEPAAPPEPPPATDDVPPAPKAQAKREVPKYDWPKARPPAEPAPVPPPPVVPKTPLGEILVLYLSALLAILAVGLLLYLEMQNRARDEMIVQELVSLRAAVESLEAEEPAVARALPEAEAVVQGVAPPLLDFPTNDGTIDALMALQKRINALEEASRSGPLPEPSPITASRTQLLDGPTEDCIPIETRFLALTGESYPICRTDQVVRLNNITADSVMTETGANVVEGGFTKLPFGNCTLLVLSADVEGFAEMRVTCS